MQRFILLLGFCLCVCMVQASEEIRLVQFPIHQQLYPRNLTTNKAQVPVSCFVYAGSGLEQIRLTIKREEEVVEVMSKPLNFSGADSLEIGFVYDLPAELANYEFLLEGIKGGEELYLTHAMNVVAGDAYLINGQSNAQAQAIADPSDLDEFSRSYNVAWAWNYLNFSFPGNWGGRIAKRIITTYGVPVAIFNQAEGAEQIFAYLRDSSDTYQGNYGALYKRLEDAGLMGNIRAAFWFHGEADGWATTTEEYKEMFYELESAWQEDYNIENTYLYQVRSQSCSHPFPYVLEAQRQIAQERSDIFIMSTGNAKHDSCHFYYEDGYRELGDRMFRVMAIQQYNAPYDEQLFAPDVMSVYRSDSSQLTLEFSRTDQLEQLGMPWADFNLENADATITSGRVDGNKIVLELSKVVHPDSVAVTYRAHPGPAVDYVINETGVSILSFYDVALGADQINPVSTHNQDLAIQGLQIGQISPNPVRDQLRVSINSTASQSLNFEIYDLLGQLMTGGQLSVGAGEQVVEIELPNALKGMYVLRLSRASAATSRRFIRE